jgi:hypothetical protein
MRPGSLVLALLCSLACAVSSSTQILAPAKFIIDDMEIEGAPHLPEAARKQIISLVKQQQLRGTPVECISKLESSVLEALRDRHNEGYWVASVGATWRLIRRDPSGDMHVSVTANLKERPTKYRVTTIRFVNNTLFPSDELRNLVPLRDGEICDLFDDSVLHKGLGAIGKLYGSYGYIDAAISNSFQIDDAHQTISFVFDVTEGRQYRIGSVHVVGLSPTLEDTLGSEVKPGNVVNPELIFEFFATNKSALPANASREDVKITRHPEDGTVDLLFDFHALPQSTEEITKAALHSGGEPVNGVQMAISRGDLEVDAEKGAIVVVTFRNLSANEVTLAPGTVFYCGGTPSKTSQVKLNLTDSQGTPHRNLPYLGGPGLCAGQIIPFVMVLQPGASLSLPLQLAKYFDLSDSKKYKEARFSPGVYSLQAELAEPPYVSEGDRPSMINTWAGTMTSNTVQVKFPSEFAAPLDDYPK